MKKLLEKIFLLFALLALCEAAKKKKKTNKNEERRQEISGCLINLPKDIPKNEPVYLRENQEIYKPIGKQMRFEPGDLISVFCPTKNNKIVNDARNYQTLKCKHGHKFQDTSNNNEYDLTAINCTKKVIGDLDATDRDCGVNGKLYKIGFKLPNGHFSRLFEVCYDLESASVIYTQHEINGRAIKSNVRESERRTFSAAGTSKGLKPYQLYTRQYQTKLFQEELGVKLNDQDPKSLPYLMSRGHLTPDADFVFTFEQFATYFYLNVAPQFQVINQGNFLKVEKLARNLAASLKSDLQIVTGTFGVLKLKNEKTGEWKSMFLDTENERIAVPEYYYKILYDPSSNSSLVLLTSNNPLLKTKEELVEICPNICSDAGVGQKKVLENFQKGYTYCCSLDDFRKKVNRIPYDLLKMKGVNLLSVKGIKF